MHCTFSLAGRSRSEHNLWNSLPNRSDGSSSRPDATNIARDIWRGRKSQSFQDSWLVFTTGTVVAMKRSDFLYQLFDALLFR